MNLSEWADRQGIHLRTAYQRFREGTSPVSSRKMVGSSWWASSKHSCPNAERSRPTPASLRATNENLDRQVAVTTWSLSRRYSIDRAVTEVGSGRNAKRRTLLSLLCDPTIRTIVLEHRDRFAKCGAEYVAASLKAHARGLIVLDDAEVENDLVGDMTQGLTSFCTRRCPICATHRVATVLNAPQGSPNAS